MNIRNQEKIPLCITSETDKERETIFTRNGEGTT
jgi:hypothetical protein